MSFHGLRPKLGRACRADHCSGRGTVAAFGAPALRSVEARSARGIKGDFGSYRLPHSEELRKDFVNRSRGALDDGCTRSKSGSTGPTHRLNSLHGAQPLEETIRPPPLYSRRETAQKGGAQRRNRRKC